MNIAISGYTAAGKTTHARLLAKALGYDVVWAAGMLLERLGFDPGGESESSLWFHRYADINELRDGTSIDADLDATLVRRAKTTSDTVFDARYLPWAADRPLLRVWLGSDLPSRARKCHVSLGTTAPSVSVCAVHVQAKDGSDVVRVADYFGAVFGPDEELFDVILDNSCFIPRATFPCAQEGIIRFSHYLHAAVLAATGDSSDLAGLRAVNPAEFRRVVHFVRGARLD